MANFRSYENQLKNYLLSRVKNRDDLQSAMRKYGSIRFAMNHERYDRPHFIIRMGISEAVFDIDTGGQLGGGLGPDSSEIKAWIARYMKKEEIKAAWQAGHKEYLTKKELEDRIAEREAKKKNRFD
ncbi:hypothetical protein IJ732_01920 [bacterium]|nr:hypothetical protein [bacterium]